MNSVFALLCGICLVFSAIIEAKGSPWPKDRLVQKVAFFLGVFFGFLAFVSSL